MPLFGGCYISRMRTVFVMLLTLSLPVLGACREPSTPVFPKLENPSLQVMEAAQRSMQDYIDRTEDYLDCLSVDERKQKMDGILSKMKQVTSQYNALKIAYRKQRTQQLFSGHKD